MHREHFSLNQNLTRAEQRSSARNSAFPSASHHSSNLQPNERCNCLHRYTRTPVTAHLFLQRVEISKPSMHLFEVEYKNWNFSVSSLSGKIALGEPHESQHVPHQVHGHRKHENEPTHRQASISILCSEDDPYHNICRSDATEADP